MSIYVNISDRGENFKSGISYSKYAMAFNFINGCSNGASCNEPNCPGAFTDPTNGELYQCNANNCGVSPNPLLIATADVHVGTD